MRKISTENLKKIELEMLIYLDRLCKKGKSLLLHLRRDPAGAVRVSHHRFIAQYK